MYECILGVAGVAGGWWVGHGVAGVAWDRGWLGRRGTSKIWWPFRGYRRRLAGFFQQAGPGLRRCGMYGRAACRYMLALRRCDVMEG